MGNEFHRNWAVTGGSGVAVVGLSAALIESNRFERDRPSLLGGTVDLSNASGSVVLNNDFAPSDGKAIHVLRSQDVRIEGNSIGGEGQFAGGFYARRARGLELRRRRGLVCRRSRECDERGRRPSARGKARIIRRPMSPRTIERCEFDGLSCRTLPRTEHGLRS